MYRKDRYMAKIGNIILGQGLPKICIPLVARDEEGINRELDIIEGLDFDILEFRLDCFEGFCDYSRLKFLVKLIKKRSNKPLIITLRTKYEGGNVEINDSEYFDLLERIIEDKLAEAIDIEYMRKQERVVKLVALAEEKGLTSILSNHDFNSTPERKEIVTRLENMIGMGADVAKIALMPACPDDVLNLLGASSQVKAKYPNQAMICISMGQMGTISRLAGGVFGSDMIFASALEESAPGQLPAENIRKLLDILA